MSDTPETPHTPGPPVPFNREPESVPKAVPSSPTATPAPSSPAATPASSGPTEAPASSVPTAPTAPLASNGSVSNSPALDGAPPISHHGLPPAGPAEQASSSEPRKRSRSGLIVAAIAVGALVGGATGAGVTLVATGNDGAGTPSTANVDPATINVNDPGNATTVTAVAAKASPSVVTIGVTTSSAGGTGSGVIISEDGYIITNTHVVTLDGASGDGDVEVTFNDGRIAEAEIVGTDPVSDLAVIKVETTGLIPVEFADSSALNVGDSAIAIGAPLGLSGTVTDGIVSALNRSITIASSAVPDEQSSSQDGSDGGNLFGFDLPGQSPDPGQAQSSGTISIAVVQTDAAINPGNSGGALLNADGQLIGINVAIASAGEGQGGGAQAGSIGVGFSIPSNLAKRVSDEIIANGEATHGLLGASIASDQAGSSSSSRQNIAGAVISDLTAGGSAEQAGLQQDDIITKFNGLPVTDYTDLIAQVRAVAAGATATVTYVRDGQASDVEVTLGTLE